MANPSAELRAVETVVSLRDRPPERFDPYDIKGLAPFPEIDYFEDIYFFGTKALPPIQRLGARTIAFFSQRQPRYSVRGSSNIVHRAVDHAILVTKPTQEQVDSGILGLEIPEFAFLAEILDQHPERSDSLVQTGLIVPYTSTRLG